MTKYWTKGAALGLAAAMAMLLLVACKSGQAGQTPDSAVPAQSPPAVNPLPTDTPETTTLPRRTPVNGERDTSPDLIAAYVNVLVTDGQLTVSESRVVAEEVYFQVKVAGEEDHGLEVLRWDGDPAKIPVEKTTNQVQAASQIAGSLPTMEPGNTEIFEIEPMAPGRYVVFCNEPGHYAAGEFAAFEVVAP